MKRIEQKEDQYQRDDIEIAENEKEYYRKMRTIHYKMIQMMSSIQREHLGIWCVCAHVIRRWQEDGATEDFFNDHSQIHIIS